MKIGIFACFIDEGSSDSPHFTICVICNLNFLSSLINFRLMTLRIVIPCTHVSRHSGTFLVIHSPRGDNYIGLIPFRSIRKVFINIYQIPRTTHFLFNLLTLKSAVARPVVPFVTKHYDMLVKQKKHNHLRSRPCNFLNSNSRINL